MTVSVGILGVGHLASYLVRGWVRSGAAGRIVLSPRNRERSSALAKQHGCTVAADNQAVVDQCEVVVLSARPSQIPPMAEALSFRGDQLLISVAAGLALDGLQDQIGETTIVRALPVSSAAINRSPTLLFPGEERAASLFSLLGPVHVLENEELFTAAACVSAFHGWVYGWLGVAVRWARAQGLSEASSRDLVLQAALGAVEMCTADPDRSPESHLESLATPGGFTALGLRILGERGGMAAWREALDAVAEAMRRASR